MKIQPQKNAETPNAILVFTNMPDRESAEQLAQALIAEKIAACVNIMSPCTSIYHWQDKTESSSEIPLLIKTRMDCYADVESTILQLHPYELPEIIYVPIAGGLPAYLTWLVGETTT